MSLHYYDWEGNWKIVDCAGYGILLGPNANIHNTSEWWVNTHGRRPDFRGGTIVDQQFHDKWKTHYEAKHFYFDGDDAGGGEL